MNYNIIITICIILLENINDDINYITLHLIILYDTLAKTFIDTLL